MTTIESDWLREHPARDETWLRARLNDGFSLVYLYGAATLMDCEGALPIEKRRAAKRAQADIYGRQAYDLRVLGLSWVAIDEKLEKSGLSQTTSSIARARGYATRNGLTWPIPMERVYRR